MLIGADYEKIEFEFLGLDLLEPNSFVGDFIIFTFSFIFAYKVSKMLQTNFVKNWKYFFIVFGIGFLFGGLGHLMYNYWGVPGKYIGWFAGMTSVFLIEKAMLPFLSNPKLVKTLLLFSKIKFILAIIAEILVIYYVDLEQDYSVAMKVPIINSTIGLVYTLAILGFVFSKKITPGFRFFLYSVLIMLPSLVFQSQKISFAPWFDKNDISHIFLLVGVIFYYLGVKSVANYQKELTH